MNSSEPGERSVLVLGANGRFGQAALQAFAAAGWRVLAQARREPPQALPAGVRLLARPMAELAAPASGVQAVVHALNPPYPQWTQQALPLARQAMDLAQQLGARFMLPGNVYNFGSTMPPLLQIDTEQRADTVKGRIRVEMESELRARSGQGLQAVVIRAGDFYGTGRGAWLDQVVLGGLRKGKLVYPGPLDVPHAWAYLPDLARAFVAVAALPELPAFTRLHFAGHTLTGAQLLAAVERAAASLDLAPARGWRRGSLPWRLMRLGAPFVPLWRELLEMEYLWRVPHALDDSALQAEAGPLPSTPPDAALRATLQQLGYGTPGTAAAPPASR
ncbi:MAG TPA: epimerase [Rubrivivax sp.]|nr:epimerase [Rubrivivax sp.]